MNRSKRTDKVAANDDLVRATLLDDDSPGPESISLLEGVLETYCVEVGITDRVEIGDIGAIIFTLWQMGYRSEAQLLEQLRSERRE